MPRQTFIALALVLLFLQTGCSLVRELKEDPAIVGATGANIIIGFDVTPSSAIPMPKVHFSWGASFRVGAHECVYISTAGGASAYIQQPGAAAPPPAPAPPASNAASCIPVVTQAPSPNLGDGSGGAGQAYLTISANGLDALKARWHQNAQLDLLIGALRDDKLTAKEVESILKQLVENTKAGHSMPSSLPASQK